MKKLAIALLMLCGVTGTLKAQTSVNNIRNITKDGLAALKVIKSLSFTPAGILQSNIISELKFDKTGDRKNLEVSASNIIESLTGKQFKYAMMMNVAAEFLSNLTLYNFIDDWYGTRYRMGGTTKKGIDCSAFTGGLLLCVYGFVVPRTAKEQYKATEHINKEELHEGDLVFFNTRGGVSHVGLYLSNNHFVHSSSSSGVVISSLDDPYYSRRFITGGRMIPRQVL